MQRHTTLYIYADQEPAEQLEWYHCWKCKRVMFKVNSSRMLLSNAYGASFTELPPSSNYIEYQCHQCQTYYQILFQ